MFLHLTFQTQLDSLSIIEGGEIYLIHVVHSVQLVLSASNIAVQLIGLFFSSVGFTRLRTSESTHQEHRFFIRAFKTNGEQILHNIRCNFLVVSRKRECKSVQ
jgi:hypothetical protein